MVRINPQRLFGNWRAGVALDFHTISSTVVGTKLDGQPDFETVYTDIGWLLHQLKYRSESDVAPSIIDAAVGFLTPHRHKIDLIVPVPPSSHRAIQPVEVLATGIAESLDLQIEDCVIKERATPALKAVDDPDQRRRILEGAFAVRSGLTEGRNVLIIDDLFRSGATAGEVAETLKRHGRAASVRLLTITCTRARK